MPGGITVGELPGEQHLPSGEILRRASGAEEGRRMEREGGMQQNNTISSKTVSRLYKWSIGAGNLGGE